MTRLSTLILSASLVSVSLASSLPTTAYAQPAAPAPATADEVFDVSPDSGVSPNATCSSYPVYTTWLYRSGAWKPTIYIWGLPGGGEERNTRGISIYYYDPHFKWEQVPASSDWGIRLIPQDRRDRWTGYFIASRWYWWHPAWDDDWRWRVYICR